jgi:FimV-like protein
MEAFEAFAAKLASAGRKKDVEFWRTVTQMGSEICKDSVLFNHQFPIENIPHEIKDIPITHGDYLPMVTPVSNILSDNSVINHDQNQSNSVEFDISSPVLKQNEDEIGNTSVINQNDEASSLNNSNTNNPLQRNFYGTPIGSQINNEQMTHFDLTDMDEMETKLDLAKAYIDMSDIGSAKEMIAEVIMKGTEQQQLIAKNLLQDLKL